MTFKKLIAKLKPQLGPACARMTVGERDGGSGFRQPFFKNVVQFFSGAFAENDFMRAVIHEGVDAVGLDKAHVLRALSRGNAVPAHLPSEVDDDRAGVMAADKTEERVEVVDDRGDHGWGLMFF